MASRRKSTTPCMVRTSQVVEQDVPEEPDRAKEKGVGTPQPDMVKDGWTAEPENPSKENEVIEVKPTGENQSKKLQGGYECKYCPYSTQNLNEFTEHVDMQHPNVILNPLYVCAECNFTTKKYDSLSDHNTKFHPGETNFKLKLIKRNNQTVLEQSIEASNHVISITSSGPGSGATDPGISVIKTPIMKPGKPKADAKKAPKKAEDAAPENHVAGTARLVTDAAEILSRLGGVELLQDTLGHVMPSVQLPPNINLVPKVPVPLNTTKYNSALDTNATMINSFNKFPYPTQAELSWLTAASKHPEEHIRIWFATQRLKHGISWSPEEVEEARKKMFNGTIQSVPQTITVLPAQLAPTKIAQPILQTALPCQILGQTSLVLTQVTSGSTTVSCSPITLAVAGVTNHGQKRPLVTPQAAPEPKRPHVAQVPEPPPKAANPTLTPASDRKKTKEQIAHLKASFLQSQFPDDAEVYRLIEATGLARSEIKKWFSDHRYRCQRGIVHITSESLAKDQLAIAASRHGRTYHAYPDFAPQKFKEKTQSQVKILEDSFLKSSFPTQAELDRLRAETKLSRREVDSWFSERRKLRDSMEQAVLDSMGSGKKGQDVAAPNGALSRLDQLSSAQLASPLPSPSPAIAKSQEQVHLLRSTFARTQWPTPQEYDQLAAKTGLVRTEIVRWFKENRCLLKTGTVKWMERYLPQHIADDHGYDIASRKATRPIAESPKNGSEAVQQYHRDPTKLCEEDLEKPGPGVKAGGEQAKDGLPAKPAEATSDRPEGNGRDGQGGGENGESGVVDWVEVTVGEEDTVSDRSDSWSQTAPEGPAELADSDSDGVAAEAGQE
ncbi:zinc fingers and homeoboxes protein 2 [Dasypus novemcinctus]|uniref:zinc fingers and homeoboxes protein 2 n=1 Tax=Dasypus novemcinctus TaxID=9361 RepID=UPI00032925ED|nr:zinc fingers and homeoboxes protein 2 [Dasypus novemcinctus]XP_004482158.1 zinc fingers and homeoboxes protein 2 [Dasypus novemcinctus]XP_004482160.1 zinc fingers and homeoboxes protein 2 [Dasypus novemcinctus]XP_058131952.1 zinc fingers and homeoboxes protein 2 [Dasypus novemcinctus]XP_058131953.1 zinc fingers and homeoboxes protein 2 [Dasypus novemcinctus]